jgi:hypothetical protein
VHLTIAACRLQINKLNGGSDRALVRPPPLVAPPRPLPASPETGSPPRSTTGSPQRAQPSNNEHELLLKGTSADSLPTAVMVARELKNGSAPLPSAPLVAIKSPSKPHVRRVSAAWGPHRLPSEAPPQLPRLADGTPEARELK